MKWFRQYAEFATDPKVQMMPETYQRRLVMLFCFRCNDDVTLQDSEVTFMLRINETEWQETKVVFIEKGFIDESNVILNWNKRQYKSDSSNERVKRHRKQRCNVTVTPPDTDTDTDTDKRRITPIEASANFEFEMTGKNAGLTPEEVAAEYQAFKNYYDARPDPRVKDYQPLWQNWVNRIIKTRKVVNGTYQPNHSQNFNGSRKQSVAEAALDCLAAVESGNL